MKNRAYRRYMEEVIVLRRMKYNIAIYNWYGYEDVNKIKRSNIMVKDLIKTNHNFMYKTYTTDRFDTRYNTKYSSNRNRKSYDNNRNRNTRLYDKHEFRKLLKEHGIK